MTEAVNVPSHRGTDTGRRVLVICLCLLYFFALTLQHGNRHQNHVHCLKLTTPTGMRHGGMKGHQLKSIFVEVIFQIQFLFTIAIISSVVLLEGGLAIVTDDQCYAATLICIALFGISKAAL